MYSLNSSANTHNRLVCTWLDASAVKPVTCTLLACHAVYAACACMHDWSMPFDRVQHCCRCLTSVPLTPPPLGRAAGADEQEGGSPGAPPSLAPCNGVCRLITPSDGTCFACGRCICPHKLMVHAPAHALCPALCPAAPC